MQVGNRKKNTPLSLSFVESPLSGDEGRLLPVALKIASPPAPNESQVQAMRRQTSLSQFRIANPPAISTVNKRQDRHSLVLAVLLGKCR